MWHDILVAIALMLVIEGLLPFLSPGNLRQALAVIIQMDDRQLRMGGLVSMIAGVVLLYVVN